jgi:hypothetical protein
MISMTIVLDGENAWPDLKEKPVIQLGSGAPAIQVGVLDAGMKSGRPSVAFRFDLPDGQTVIAETSARLFVTAARAIEAKYPDLFED